MECVDLLLFLAQTLQSNKENYLTPEKKKLNDFTLQKRESGIWISCDAQCKMLPQE